MTSWTASVRERYVGVDNRLVAAAEPGEQRISPVTSIDSAISTGDSSVAQLLEIFDVTSVEDGRYAGISEGGFREVVEGTQLLAQAIVAAAKSCPGKSIRSVRGVFTRAVSATEAIYFDVDIIHEGRSMASVNVTVSQGARRCATVSVLADVPTGDVIRHHVQRPQACPPAEAYPADMPMSGREIRLVDVVDVNSPDELGPPELCAWLHYDPIPSRDDLAKALIAHFTGHLSVSTTMRAHRGIGTSQAHHTVSTGVMAVSVSFHEPVRWDDWILYSHESTQVGAGMSYVRGHVHTEDGALLASFTQEAMIRPLRPQDSAIPVEARL